MKFVLKSTRDTADAYIARLEAEVNRLAQVEAELRAEIASLQSTRDVR